MFKIATWNVNSLSVRLPHVLAWLEQHQPDILALQEIKCENHRFPYEAFHECAYHALVSGQKTYNGLALLSKRPMSKESLCMNFPNFIDGQSRVLGAQMGDVFVLNLYVPNGSAIGTDKYQYKLQWLQHLHEFVAAFPNKKMIILGDFNIAPGDIDVHDVIKWQNQILVSDEERRAWRSLLDLGFIDAYRFLYPQGRDYSWWDYRQASFQRGLGLRIDHVLISASLQNFLSDCLIDSKPRAWTRPSDHAPVMASFMPFIGF